jgi:hypothetical protein
MNKSLAEEIAPPRAKLDRCSYSLQKIHPTLLG